MKNWTAIKVLNLLLALFATIAAGAGIFYKSGGSEYLHESIRGQMVRIYGKGIYKHMSADVAIQGIAHDFVTLFMGIPLLLFGLWWAKKGSLKSMLFIAGVLKYFFLTYLFYMNMAMYNSLFLLYILLVSTSFFALVLVLLEIEVSTLRQNFSRKTPVKLLGGFLVFISLAIGCLWLGVILTPLIDGSVIPASVEHYTSLTVQGLDLSIFLPIAFLSGLLLWKRKNFGFLMAGVTYIFLCLLMSALVSKIIAMALARVNVVPAVFIIPGFLIMAVIGSLLLFKHVRQNNCNRINPNP